VAVNTSARKAPLPDSWRLALEFHHRGGILWGRTGGARVGWIVGREECVAAFYGRWRLYVDAIGERWQWPVWFPHNEPCSRLFDGVRLVEIDGPRAVTLAEWRR
jgi:hypothetical protein